MNAGSPPVNNPGSSNSDEPVFVAAARFRKPHGLRGEIRSTVLTDFPDLLKPGARIFIGPKHRPAEINTVRQHGSDLLISLAGYPDRTAVEILRNQIVFLREEDCPPLSEGEFYIHEVVGLQVISDQGEELGQIKEVILTGANDVYVVERAAEKDLLLPAIEDVILEILPEKNLMRVHLIPGLLDI